MLFVFGFGVLCLSMCVVCFMFQCVCVCVRERERPLGLHVLGAGEPRLGAGRESPVAKIQIYSLTFNLPT